MGTSRGGRLYLSEHMKYRLCLLSERQTEAGGSRPLPQAVSAITVINGDQNTQVTQSEPADHLSGGESSAAPTVNTGPSDARVGGSIACVHLDTCVCICVCVRGFQSADGKFPLWSSEIVTVVSSVLQLCL